MAIKTRRQLKEEFRNGEIPDQNDFGDTIDSALNLNEDGLVSYKVQTPSGMLKRFGVGGDTAPQAPIGIKGEPGQDDQMIYFTSSDESQKWNINLNPTGNDVDGFSIDDASSGIGSSRFFIDHVSEGNIGIGNVSPQAKLHVTGANDGANVSIMVENLESGPNGGWLMSAIDDNSVPERTKTFAIHEKRNSDLIERITVLSTQGPASSPVLNVGVNEVLPYATLHVTKPAADPTEPVNLAENTGILCLGQIDSNNLAMDSRQIQARLGEYVASGPTLAFTASELGLQPYGGGLTINGRSHDANARITIDTTGNVGIGKTATEKLEVNGAIVVGDTDNAEPVNGTVRWSVSNDDLEVWKDDEWNSLTTHVNTDGIWTNAGDGVVYYSPTGELPKVGIGTSDPNATLHVREVNEEAAGTAAGLAVVNQAATDLVESNHMRIGVGVSCSGVWSTNPAALNVGLYVSSVIGQTEAASNIGALINGSTVIGDITGNSLVGTGGTNVLAIQNGTAPISAPGITETTGVQMYSANVIGPEGTDISVLHLMTGDGAVMRFYRQPNMTEADINSPNTGNAVTDALITNMRTRIGELEGILKRLGLLTP
jgi:hypothetical protein